MYLGWFASKYPAMLRLTPLREILIDATSKINFENFENVIQFLDKRNTEGQHKVNMTGDFLKEVSSEKHASR